MSSSIAPCFAWVADTGACLTYFLLLVLLPFRHRRMAALEPHGRPAQNAPRHLPGSVLEDTAAGDAAAAGYERESDPHAALPPSADEDGGESGMSAAQWAKILEEARRSRESPRNSHTGGAAASLAGAAAGGSGGAHSPQRAASPHSPHPPGAARRSSEQRPGSNLRSSAGHASAAGAAAAAGDSYRPLSGQQGSQAGGQGMGGGQGRASADGAWVNGAARASSDGRDSQGGLGPAAVWHHSSATAAGNRPSTGRQIGTPDVQVSVGSAMLDEGLRPRSGLGVVAEGWEGALRGSNNASGSARVSVSGSGTEDPHRLPGSADEEPEEFGADAVARVRKHGSEGPGHAAGAEKPAGSGTVAEVLAAAERPASGGMPVLPEAPMGPRPNSNQGWVLGAQGPRGSSQGGFSAAGSRAASQAGYGAPAAGFRRSLDGPVLSSTAEEGGTAGGGTGVHAHEQQGSLAGGVSLGGGGDGVSEVEAFSARASPRLTHESPGKGSHDAACGQ